MKERLYEMDLCRVYATISIVVTHSFAPYSGAWPIPVESVYAYKCIGIFAVVFTLCLFVFISGYVYSYQESVKPHIDKRWLIWKKFKRLIIPCLFWGGLYVLLFGEEITSLKGIFAYFSGVGHLWFLPMLFWVFMFFLSIQSKKQGKKLLIPLFLVSIITPNIMSLGVLSALYYLVWFYLGYLIFKNRETIPSIPRTYIALLSLALIIIFVSYVEVRPILNTLRDMGVIYKFFFQIAEHSILFPVVLVGVAIVYLISLRIKRHNGVSGNETSKSFYIVKLISQYSMGIYIFHDFVLEILYRYTDFLCSMQLYAPWLAFVLSITLSLLFAIIVSRVPYLRKTT